MSFTSAKKGRVADSRSLTPIPSVPPVQETKPADPPDPNMANPRLILNRALIYERRLPGDAYITAHVQRLQHGYYSCDEVSDKDAEHVDFLAIAFTFHSPHTLDHRIKSAMIKVSVHGSPELSSSKHYPYGYPPGNPRFLMHAPHLLYGTVSPETMEWTFSLAGSLGISEMPVSASVIPSGSVNGRYKRYEMMRVQGSARTLKNGTDSRFDVESGQIVWSMEENNVQRSGLPREFTFVMLVQKPTAKSKVFLSIDVEPVIDALVCSYPAVVLKMPDFRPLPRRGVDFQQEVGQRFEPADPERGFNFANLGSMFDEYIAMPGRKYSRQMQIPADTGVPENHFHAPFPGQYGPPHLNPYQQQLQTNNLALQNNGLSLQNNLLQTTLQNLGNTHRGEDTPSHQQQAAPQRPESASHPSPAPPTITVNVHHLFDPNALTTLSHLPNLTHSSPATNPLGAHRAPRLRRSRARDVSITKMSGTSSSPSPTDSMIPQTGTSERLSDITEHSPEPLPRTPLHTPETARRLRRKADPLTVSGQYGRSRVMNLVNSPLSASLLSALAER